MTTLHMLTVRTNAALGRLASLQKRVEKVPAPTAPVVRSALKELSDSLDELQAANDQLQQQVDESIALKQRVQEEQLRLREFINAVPVPCVWTSASGEIEDANSAAADLLNVSTQHLIGRPLMLFTTERVRFSDSLGALNDRLTSIVELALVVRPRERRARAVRLIGRRLEHDARRCWFIIETAGAADGVPEPTM